jgi:hypothetical protein
MKPHVVAEKMGDLVRYTGDLFWNLWRRFY